MTLRVNELFCSLQGEGQRAGTSNIFIRLSGCNLTCSKDGEAGFDCDTEFTSGSQMDVEAIEALIDKMLVKDNCVNPKAIIWTGGEPLLQLNRNFDVLRKFSAKGYYQAVETNGTVDTGYPFDWISCSPKSAEHTLKLKRVNELRYVRSLGQSIPKPTIQDVVHYMISPAFEADGTLHPMTLQHCIKLVKENPKWQLSVQQHKAWKVQ